MAIKQKPMGKVVLLGGVKRVVRAAKLAPGVKYVTSPREAWRIK